MFEEGQLKETKLNWNSSIVLEKMKNGTTRCCTDYGKLNSATIMGAYPLLGMEEN